MLYLTLLLPLSLSIFIKGKLLKLISYQISSSESSKKLLKRKTSKLKSKNLQVLKAEDIFSMSIISIQKKVSQH